MKKIFTILAVATLALVSCVRTDDITAVQERIDALSGKIASITDQVTSINATLKTLEQVDSDMDAYMDELEKSVALLSKDQDAQQDRIDAINKDLDALKDCDKAIQKQIDDLKEYADKGLKENEDWMKATFETLEKYKALCADVASLEVRIGKCEAAFEGLEDKITKDYTEAIKKAIEDSKTSMQAWVNEQLKGYYDIEKTDAELKALEDEVTGEDADLLEEVKNHQKAIAGLRTEIEAAYKKAIEDAIKDCEGELNEKIEADIKAAQDALQTQLDTIDNEIESIQARLADVEARIDRLIAQIQSVVVVPYYEDGSVAFFENETNVLTFDVRPVSAITSLVNLADLSVFSFKVVETKGDEAPELEIQAAKVNEKGRLELTVGTDKMGDGFFAGTKTFSASLNIKSKDGVSDCCSKYFTICASRIKLNGAAAGEQL